MRGAAAVVRERGHLTVYASASGLKPGSTHTEQIHAGLCGGNGPARYPLNPLVADRSGRASAVSRVMIGTIQTMGWSIALQGTGTSSAPIACGNVWGPDLWFTLLPALKGSAHGAAIILGNMDTRGGMEMRDTGVVVVTLVRGLPANTTHTEHLQRGTCGSNGASIFPLTQLTADAAGNAVAATFLGDMAPVMAGGLSLNVLAADSAVVACGNDDGKRAHNGM